MGGDPRGKVACLIAAKGKITTQTMSHCEKIVCGVAADIGFDSYVDDLSGVDSKGLTTRPARCW